MGRITIPQPGVLGPNPHGANPCDKMHHDSSHACMIFQFPWSCFYCELMILAREECGVTSRRVGMGEIFRPEYSKNYQG